MPFAHAQATAVNFTNTTGATSLSAVLTHPPANGDLVCVACFYDASQTTVTSCVDGNSNIYTRSVSSPSSAQNATSGSATLFYWVANSNGSATVTFQFTSLPAASNGVVIIVDDFSVSGGTAHFDKDAAGSSTVAGTTVNTPVFSPTVTGQLFYAYVAPQHICTAINSPWVGTIETNVNTCAEYILSASGSQNPNVTQTSGVWDSIMAAFTVVSNYTIEEYGQVTTFGRSV